MINVAVITDALGWHLESWAALCGESEQVERVLLYDPSQAQVRLVRRKVGNKLVGVYSNPADLFAEHEVQLTVVTMSPAVMPTLARTALEAGSHVLIEKPGATSPEAYASLVELANARGLFICMALDNLFPIVREARQMVAEGHLGRLYGFHYLWSVGQERWRRRHIYDWWFSREEAGGGVISHVVCHAVNRMRFIMGEEVVDVTGFADVVSGEPLEVEDTVAMCVRFASGAVGVLHAGFWEPAIVSPSVLPSDSKYHAGPAWTPHHHTFRVWGEKGCLYADVDEGRLELAVQATEMLRPLRGSAARTVPHHLVKRIPQSRPPYGRDLFFYGLLAAIRGEGPPPNSNEDGLRYLEIQHALYRASQTGVTQHLNKG